MFARRCKCVVVSLCYLALCGCDSDNPTANTPDEQTADIPAAVESDKPLAEPRHPIDEESHDWSLEEALANLEEPDLGLSAAVRLVRLADVHVPMLPDPLPMEAARKLRLIALSDSAYALGVRDDDNERLVRTPLLIDLEGNVSEPGDEDEDESYVLYVSRDGQVFPHLLVGRTTVLNAASPGDEQVRLKTTDSMHFEVRQENGVDYLSLIHDANGEVGEELPDGDEAAPLADDPPAAETPTSAPTTNSAARPAVSEGPIEAARYQWDPFESMFMGPAADKLPPPLKGRFELDLESSSWLQPVGGEIGEPDDISPPREEDENDWD